MSNSSVFLERLSHLYNTVFLKVRSFTFGDLTDPEGEACSTIIEATKKLAEMYTLELKLKAPRYDEVVKQKLLGMDNLIDFLGVEVRIEKTNMRNTYIHTVVGIFDQDIADKCYNENCKNKGFLVGPRYHLNVDGWAYTTYA